MPRLVRGIFRRRQELLGDLAQCSAETRPGIVVSIATSGDLVQWHVHQHILVTDGAFSDDGTFHPLATWDGEPLMRLFRERLLARLVERHAISEELNVVAELTICPAGTTTSAWRKPLVPSATRTSGSVTGSVPST